MQSGKTVAASYSLQLRDEQKCIERGAAGEMLSNRFPLSAYYQKETSHFFQDAIFLLLPG